VLAPESWRTAPVLVSALATVLVLLTATGCTAPLRRETTADRTTPPKLGACYRLTPQQTGRASSDLAPVPCSGPHTAQTFAVGTLPASTGKSYSAAGHGRWVYPRCKTAFEKFLSIDESMALRVQLSWAWFRPSERGWGKGARWYRCDLVGGSAQATSYRELPAIAQGLFRAKPPEEWLTCAQGPSVLKGRKVPCSQQHDWRAVTTIKLGETRDAYPGDRLVEVRSRDFCSDSVGAWMNYPVGYSFGYTWFHEAEWKAGNRRSVCWARTQQ
jgi:hypothetical protein